MKALDLYDWYATSLRVGHTTMLADGVAAALARGKRVMVLCGRMSNSQAIHREIVDALLRRPIPVEQDAFDLAQSVKYESIDTGPHYRGWRGPVAVDNYALLNIAENWTREVGDLRNELRNLKSTLETARRVSNDLLDASRKELEEARQHIEQQEVELEVLRARLDEESLYSDVVDTAAKSLAGTSAPTS